MENYERYFNRYQNIDERTLEVIREVIKKGIFKLKFNKRFDLLKYLNTELSKIYKFERPNLKIILGDLKKEHKKINKKEIVLNDNLGVLYFLVRFNLIMQLHSIKKYNKTDAINWSFSVLYNAEPDFFNKVFSKLIEQKKKEEPTITYTLGKEDNNQITDNGGLQSNPLERNIVERRLENKWYFIQNMPLGSLAQQF